MNYKEEIERATKEIGELDKEDPFSKDNGRIKVFYGEPSGGLIDCVVYDNRKDFLMEMSKWKYHSKFDFFTVSTGRMHTSYARELLAEEAVRVGADFILFIDDDMMVPKDMFPALMKHADKADMIAPLCFQRLPPYNPVIYDVKEKKQPDGRMFIYTDAVRNYPRDDVFQADAVGFGVVLIKVEILKKLPKPWFFSNNMIGEDIYFCLEAKKRGFKLLIDSSIKVGHMAGPRPITELDFFRVYGTETDKDKHKDELGKHESEMTPLVEVKA